MKKRVIEIANSTEDRLVEISHRIHEFNEIG